MASDGWSRSRIGDPGVMQRIPKKRSKDGVGFCGCFCSTRQARLREDSTPLAGDELLPTVDVVGRSREGRIGHDVHSERGNVGRPDNAPDGKRSAKLLTAVFELITEERCRQGCVDKAGG